MSHVAKADRFDSKVMSAERSIPVISFSRVNNFNLIRLLAAAQVMFFHTIYHLQLKPHAVLNGLLNFVEDFFPGVPIFFVISGFLIALSYERIRCNLRSYLVNRVLRLYPALYVCFVITLLILLVAGLLTREFVLSSKFWLWTLGQLTFVQFLNPSEFRGFGVGVINGALWTISTEINFYLLLPLLYSLFSLKSRTLRYQNILFLVLGTVSFCFYVAYLRAERTSPGVFSWAKLLFVSVLPHLWLFLFGVTIYKNWVSWARFIKGKFVIWFSVYLALCVSARFAKMEGWPSDLLLLVHRCTLAFVTVSAAFSNEGLTTRYLRDYDISYGVYIYHLLFVNIFVHAGFRGNYLAALGVFACALLFAFLSWRYVESAALAQKGRFLPATT